MIPPNSKPSKRKNSAPFMRQREKSAANCWSKSSAGKHGSVKDDTVSRALAELYALGIKPDWWKLEPQANAAAWGNIEKVIKANDPYCRGIVLLGLDAPEEDLARAFATTAGHATSRDLPWAARFSAASRKAGWPEKLTTRKRQRKWRNALPIW